MIPDGTTYAIAIMSVLCIGLLRGLGFKWKWAFAIMVILLIAIVAMIWLSIGVA